jgi:hypothetical protein
VAEGEPSSGEPIGQRASPKGWVVLNPFHEERKRSVTDVVDSAFCVLFVGWRGAATKDGDPEAEGMSAVGRLAWGGQENREQGAGGGKRQSDEGCSTIWSHLEYEHRGQPLVALEGRSE